MNTLMVFIVLFVALFGAAYFTKRRFGVLGLALCAGSLLSASWTATLTPMIQSQGVELVTPPLAVVVAALLILAPPFALLFSGPKYSSQVQRLVGSAAFGLMGLVFLLMPLGAALTLSSTSYQVYNFLSSNSSAITVAGIIAALADILMTRQTHRSGKKADH